MAWNTNDKQAMKKVDDVAAQVGVEIDSLTQQLADTNEEVDLLESSKMDKSTSDISVFQINKNKGKLDQTYMSDEFLQQILGDTPLNTTPENLSVTTEKIAQKSISFDKTNFIKTGKNLVNKEVMKQGYIVNASGVETINADYYTSDYFNIKPSSQYTGSSLMTVSLYDVNKTFIENVTLNNTILETTINTHYAKVSVHKSYYPTIQLEEGLLRTAYEKHFKKIEGVQIDESNLSEDLKEKQQSVDFLERNIKYSKNILNPTNSKKGYAINQLGAEIEQTAYTLSDYIEIKSNREYSINTGMSIAQYDEKKAFLKFDSLLAASQITTHPTARYFRVAVLSEKMLKSQIEKGGQVSTFEPYHNPYIIGMNPNQEPNLIGKRILFLGDSNTHINKFTEIISEKTGAITYNGGFSATLLSDMTATNSNQWNQMHGCAVADAIASKDFSELDGFASYIDGETVGWYPTTFVQQLQNIKNAVADISNLDYIVAMYGTNDVTRAELTVDENVDSLDKSKWNGAINYFIKTILEAHPHVKIYMVSPVFRLNMSQSLELTGSVKNSDEWARSMMLPEMVEVERERTKANHVPFIDLYNESGINKYTGAHYLKPIPDGTHFSVAGDLLVSEKITKGLLSK